MIFKPEDFKFEFESISYIAANQANNALKIHLATLPMVYGYNGTDAWYKDKLNDFTHTALLWCVSEIEKKECEHIGIARAEVDYVVGGLLEHPLDRGSRPIFKESWYCIHCGIKLKAKWEAVCGQ